jgi:O-antigen/teichoic acid export membrane protein
VRLEKSAPADDSMPADAETALTEEEVEQLTPEPASGYGTVAAKGTSLAMLSQLVRSVLQIGSLAVLARFLGPRDFGVVASVTAVVGVADILRDFGLSSASVQAKRLTDGERTNLFWANVCLGSGCGVIVFAAAPLVAWMYHLDSLVPVTFALASVFVITGFMTQFNSELTRNLRFGAIAISEISGYAGSIAIAIVLAVLGAGYWAIVAQQISAVVITLIISVSLCPWRPTWWRREVSIRRFFRFGRGVLGTQLIAYATLNSDNIAVGTYWGPSVLGVYSRAYQLLMVPLNQINRPLTRVALPILSRVQDNQEMFTRYLQKAQVVGCYVTATVFAFVTALSEPIVAILFGPHWKAVAPVLAVLAAGGVFRAISQISYWAYLARGQTGAQFRLYLITRPPMIGMMIAGLPWGATGVAVGSSVAYTLYWLVSLLRVGPAVGIDSMPLLRNGIRSVLVVSAPAGLMAFIGVVVVDQPVLQLAIGLCLGLGYIAALVAMVPFVRRDLGTVWHFASQTLRSKARVA